MSELVHWHEGLFLQPHHLQTMQRQMLDRLSAERRVTWSYPYGVIEAKLSADALENHIVRFDRLRVIMPGGAEVNVPESAELPPLDIKPAFESSTNPLTVSLGLPLWYSSRGNTIEPGGGGDWRMKRLYHVAEAQRSDENTGENPQPVMVRRLNARLMLDGADTTDLEVLRLLRISHASGQEVGLPRQDPAFIPPCMVLAGSTVLRELVRELANQVEASRKELVQRMARGGFSVETMRGLQFEQMLRLRTLNRFSARLPSIVDAPGSTPFDVYLELRQLLGELASLRPDRDPFDAARYDHENPALAFFELDEKIRPFLKEAVTATWAAVKFVREGPILTADLKDEHFTVPNDYYLAVQTRQDARAVAALVEDGSKFKLMAKSMVRQAVFGVKLAEERQPPLVLPAQGNPRYFRLLRAESARMWEQAKNDKGLAVTVRAPDIDTSDFAVTLYMTMPEAAAKA